ncbi:MAG: hypothetical protein HPZ91_07260 [Lentisphaeria bacterium]|nr:hypothetical protein [Lentisphaeria bacterium]
MMKKFFAAILLAATVAASACWVDGSGEMILPGAQTKIRIDGQVANSRITVALPATVEVWLARYDKSRPINRIMLQYRAGTSGDWITLYDLSRVPESDQFIPLFGTGTLKPDMFPEAQTIQIRLYITDGRTQSFDPDNPDSGAISITVSPNRRPSYE